jgi:hypothetical protein
MQLPNKEKAHISREKLVDYLLSEKHAVGKSKAKFFRRFGFDETNVGQLERALLTIARQERVIEINASVHGAKYVIDGVIRTPEGAVVRVRTVWIVETGQDAPRFVTAHPLERSQE